MKRLSESETVMKELIVFLKYLWHSEIKFNVEILWCLWMPPAQRIITNNLWQQAETNHRRLTPPINPTPPNYWVESRARNRIQSSSRSRTKSNLTTSRRLTLVFLFHHLPPLSRHFQNFALRSLPSQEIWYIKCAATSKTYSQDMVDTKYVINQSFF